MTNTREERVAEIAREAFRQHFVHWKNTDWLAITRKILAAAEVEPSPDVWEAIVRDLLDAAERGLEWAIDAANECRPEKDDAIFENAMRDIRRIEAAMTKARALLPGPPKVTVEEDRA